MALVLNGLLITSSSGSSDTVQRKEKRTHLKVHHLLYQLNHL